MYLKSLGFRMVGQLMRCSKPIKRNLVLLQHTVMISCNTRKYKGFLCVVVLVA